MKRIILTLISVILLGTLGAYAQNANRKGFFIDVQAGNTFGYVLKADKKYNGKPITYTKGGLDLGAAVGMRFPTSLHWAFQFKLGANLNMSLPEAADLHLLVGMRWYSNDFWGNKSAFIGVNTGFGLVPGANSVAPNIPIDIDAGINLTNRIGLGIFLKSKFYFNDDWHEGFTHQGHLGYYDENLKNNVVAGLRFSYRF